MSRLRSARLLGDATTNTLTEEPRLDAEAILYRQFDVGYEIALDRAIDLLPASAPERKKPVRGEAQAIQIANPPVTVGLGSEQITVSGQPHTAEISARIFDFGVVSLRAALPANGMRWGEFCEFGSAVGLGQPVSFFEPCLDWLLLRIAPAISRPSRAPVTEDYVIFRVHRLHDRSGRPFPPGAISDEEIARLLLSERRPITRVARNDLLSPRFSYYEDDLTVLTWTSALVVEPDTRDTDVQYVLEFANAQLLELRYYDAALDAELPRIYEEVAAARRRFHLPGRRYSRILAVLQARVADAIESAERVENALKVTDDVFLARIYSTALDIFRGPVWRRGIDRKIGIIRDTYSMLNDESEARRSEVLEVTVIVLIFLEIVLAILWRH